MRLFIELNEQEGIDSAFSELQSFVSHTVHHVVRIVIMSYRMVPFKRVPESCVLFVEDSLAFCNGLLEMPFGLPFYLIHRLSYQS